MFCDSSATPYAYPLSARSGMVGMCHKRCSRSIQMRRNLPEGLKRTSQASVDKSSKWPCTEWEAGPTQKSRENGKENGKWPEARNGRKMAEEMEKCTKKMAKVPFRGPFFHFGGHFLAISGLGPFSIFFPIFPELLCRAGFPFCRWPLRSQDRVKMRWKKGRSHLCLYQRGQEPHTYSMIDMIVMR